MRWTLTRLNGDCVWYGLKPGFVDKEGRLLVCSACVFMSPTHTHTRFHVPAQPRTHTLPTCGYGLLLSGSGPWIWIALCEDGANRESPWWPKNPEVLPWHVCVLKSGLKSGTFPIGLTPMDASARKGLDSGTCESARLSAWDAAGLAPPVNTTRRLRQDSVCGTFGEGAGVRAPGPGPRISPHPPTGDGLVGSSLPRPPHPG